MQNLKSRLSKTYGDYINKFFQKNSNNPESQKQVLDEIMKNEFGDQTDEYNKKTDQFNDFIKSKFGELNEIEKSKVEDRKKLGSVLDKLNKQLELLENDNSTLEEILLDLNEFKSIISNFKDRFSGSKSKLNELIEHISKADKVSKKEIRDLLEKSKKDIIKYFEFEHKRIEKFLEEKSKKVIEDKYNIEKLKISEHKRNAFAFDLKLVVKYLLLLGGVIGIASIDFLLIQDLVIQEFDVGSSSRLYEQNYNKWLLITIIIPLLPSFVLIFGEFFTIKYLKNNKIFKAFIHLVSFISISFILITLIYTFNPQEFKFELVPNFNTSDALARLLIFGIAIPVIVALMDRFFNTDEFFDFIRHIILLFIFPLIGIKLFFESFILRSRKKKLLKESYIFELDSKKLDSMIRDKVNKFDEIFSIPRSFNEDLIDFSNKTENVLSQIKDLQAFISKDEIDNRGFFSKLFGININSNIKNKLDGKIERLKESIKSISSSIEEQELAIDKKYEGSINTVKLQINKVKEDRKIYKKNYEHKEVKYINVIRDILNNY